MRLLTPEILLNKNRLGEIYKLRVNAWENSNRSSYVNSQLYPSGWFDILDTVADHMIIKVDDVIIAALRINYYDVFSDHPYYKGFYKIPNINQYKNIAYISRVIVRHDYRNQGLSAQIFRHAELYITKLRKKYIGLDATGIQIEKLKKHGYIEAGQLCTSKIIWNIEPEDQMLLIKTIQK